MMIDREKRIEAEMMPRHSTRLILTTAVVVVAAMIAGLGTVLVMDYSSEKSAIRSIVNHRPGKTQDRHPDMKRGMYP